MEGRDPQMHRQAANWSPLTRIVSVMIIVIGLVMLIAGLFMPVATTERLLAEPDTYSILGGIRNLLENGNTSLALAITGFSVIFPIAKYIVILLIALRRGTLIAQGRVLRLLRFLGKWSMLDVFALALLAVLFKLGGVTRLKVETGIYWFAGAVACGIAVAIGIGSHARRIEESRTSTN